MPKRAKKRSTQESREERKRGFSYYFNNHTIHGRANVSKATLAGIFLYVIYRKFLAPPQPSGATEK